mmetsp:Transcript_9970/g.29427  ORF Transcript_9970/g.29427 Transcript_9970/m.29427 type:complete len:262 (+) Transcript_9970:2024-2809(+)
MPRTARWAYLRGPEVLLEGADLLAHLVRLAASAPACDRHLAAEDATRVLHLLHLLAQLLLLLTQLLLERGHLLARLLALLLLRLEVILGLLQLSANVALGHLRGRLEFVHRLLALLGEGRLGLHGQLRQARKPLEVTALRALVHARSCKARGDLVEKLHLRLVAALRLGLVEVIKLAVGEHVGQIARLGRKVGHGYSPPAARGETTTGFKQGSRSSWRDFFMLTVFYSAEALYQYSKYRPVPASSEIKAKGRRALQYKYIS